ncbi:hypothetical protein CFAM422_005979 [Trichoderma lentiforme]|uniref:Uncharacterized protein n=1 Tax=Trichoderma lentiforme TaxID=1567552 RepID=A0A9P4XDK1_9HYPO|nr:hypothetical protein CFAM422_005979 [Trichoderma lentiforme]
MAVIKQLNRGPAGSDVLHAQVPCTWSHPVAVVAERPGALPWTPDQVTATWGHLVSIAGALSTW